MGAGNWLEEVGPSNRGFKGDMDNPHSPTSCMPRDEQLCPGSLFHCDTLHHYAFGDMEL